MLDISSRCPQCMREIEQGSSICPFCGFPVSKRQHLPNHLQPGVLLFNRYLLGNVLRYNNEYVVYAAHDQHLDVTVDIKEFFPSQLAKRSENGVVTPLEGKEEEFNRIGLDFSNLHHTLSKFRTMTNIIQVYTLFEQHNTCYVVLEHIQGVTWREYLSEHYGELEWEHASKLFLDLIRSMANLHKNGILHCGLSPETLFMTRQNQLKLADFATMDLRTQTGVMIPQLFDGYAAPEQYNGEHGGTWTDVYSIAAVLYKTLTGTMPTSSNTRAFNDNLIAPDVLNAHVPKNVSLALMSALTLAPKIRTQTMDDLFADVVTPPRAVQKTIDLHYSEEAPVVVQPEPPEEIKTRKIILLALLVSLSVVLFGVLILMVLLFGDQWFGRH